MSEGLSEVSERVTRERVANESVSMWPLEYFCLGFWLIWPTVHSLTFINSCYIRNEFYFIFISICCVSIKSDYNFRRFQVLAESAGQERGRERGGIAQGGYCGSASGDQPVKGTNALGPE